MIVEAKRDVPASGPLTPAEQASSDCDPGFRLVSSRLFTHFVRATGTLRCRRKLPRSPRLLLRGIRSTSLTSLAPPAPLQNDLTAVKRLKISRMRNTRPKRRPTPNNGPARHSPRVPPESGDTQ